MDSSDDSSSSDSDSVASEAASAVKPLTLDPAAVRALAASANCQELIDEPGIEEEYTNNNFSRSRSSLHYATTSISSDHHPLSFDTTQTTSEEEGDPSTTNSSSSFLRRLRKTFSREEGDNNSSPQHPKQSPREKEHILSFLAFDPLSVEQLAAEADGKKKSGYELGGAGVARVDVYCRSGTVIVSRVVIVPNNNDTTLSDEPAESIAIHDDDSRSTSEDGINEPSVLPRKTSNHIQNTRIRRIIRQNVTQEALRCILSNPHTLASVDESVVAPISYDQVRAEEKLNEEDFRLIQDEMARMHVANAIITAALMGIGGDDLERVMQLDSFEYNPTDVGKTSQLIQDETDQLLSFQIEIRRNIEIADIGLAILMGEREKLEKMMGIEKGEEKKNDDNDESSEQDTTNEDDDDDNDSTESESSRSASCDYEAEELARQARYAMIMFRAMGCEVEYSFPSDLADNLEAALMGQSNNDNDSSDSDDDDSRNDVQQRGRSKTKRKVLPGESIPKKRQLGLAPIAAIPTNGEGCIVLRENGAFNVVGHIPKILEEYLFQDDAPFPEYIALGSNDRYFVKFDDGSYYFYGPNSLTRILNEKVTKIQKGKGKNRGAKNNVSIASVAFGKELDDFFIVFTDGSWECDGELHKGLDKLLNDRGNRADLLWVSLGPDNEFCVKARNGRVWWGGVSDEINEALFDITEGSETDVKYISFGVDGSYFLTHRG